MDCKIEDGYLVVKIKLQRPELSSTGRTYLIANSKGSKKTNAGFEGKDVFVSLNAYIKKK